MKDLNLYEGEETLRHLAMETPADDLEDDVEDDLDNEDEDDEDEEDAE